MLTITAVYEDGVIKPLEKLTFPEHQKVYVRIVPLLPEPLVTKKRRRAKGTREELVQCAKAAFGLWADREDVGDAVEYENRLRAGWEDRLKELNHA